MSLLTQHLDLFEELEEGSALRLEPRAPRPADDGDKTAVDPAVERGQSDSESAHGRQLRDARPERVTQVLLYPAQSLPLPTLMRSAHRAAE